MQSLQVSFRCSVVVLVSALLASQAVGQITVFAPGHGPDPPIVSQAPVVVAAVAANSFELASNGVGATIKLGVSGEDVPVTEEWGVDGTTYEQYKTRTLETDYNMTVYLATLTNGKVNVTSFTASTATAARGEHVVFSFSGIANMTMNGPAPPAATAIGGVSLQSLMSQLQGKGAFLAITVRGDDKLATSTSCKPCEEDAQKLCCIG